MLSECELNFTQYLFGRKNNWRIARFAILIFCAFAAAAAYGPEALAQGNTSGRFEGVVRDKNTGLPIPGATVVLRSVSFDTKSTLITTEDGKFGKGSLNIGDYEIEISASGYTSEKKTQPLFSMGSYNVEPVPFLLEPIKTATLPTPVVSPGEPTPTVVAVQDKPVRERANFELNPKRGGIFDRRSVNSLPLGGNTLTRTFDELAFLIPGVNPPPQAIGNSVGPGIGGGVGTSGQFSVNGLRSRANNFTVDGSDNNDEDIGVRRQGFFSLVPQPIESIQEYQVITLLAPAEFGRNLGAQVNANSRSGGNAFHGAFYGFYNSEKLNSSNFFDSDRGNTSIPLTGRQPGGASVPVLRSEEFGPSSPVIVTNSAGREDPLDLIFGGASIGGPIIRNKLFFFVSGEYQRLNGAQERHFAVPTVEQRGFVNSGATGLQQGGNPGFPTSITGDALFSLFPFPNDPNGIYGRNTYTQELSTNARGRIFSGKIDWNLFKINSNQQVLTARYNYTDDKRDLTDVGGALFSAIRPVVRTDNFSAYLTGSINNRVSNELRLSWGRTRLRFDELPDQTGFLVSPSRSFAKPEDGRFLLNARNLQNYTFPTCNNGVCTAPGNVIYRRFGNTDDNTGGTTNLGAIGQLIVAGFSPVGVDVFNFPQRRTNDTYQIADALRWQSGNHGFTFGVDLRRVFLDSNLPRNSRPLVTVNGAPDGFDLCAPGSGINCNASPQLSSGQNACPSRFCSPTDLASGGGVNGFFQALALPGSDAQIELRYNQLNFFAQDQWRINPRVTLSYGLRYEYNQTPEEVDNKIENTFSQALPGVVSQLGAFINQRRKIYEPDTDNFAPRIGLAAQITPRMVLRGGFGVFYDQILGAVVSQSRNVFPTFTTVNFGGGLTPFCDVVIGCPLEVLSPFFTVFNTNGNSFPIVAPGTLNTLNVGSGTFSQTAFLNALSNAAPLFNFDCSSGTCVRVAGSSIGATLPTRELDTPNSYQYSISIEQEIARDTFLSVAFVGTKGRDLLRFTTPNLGNSYITVVNQINLNGTVPEFTGATLDPTSNIFGNAANGVGNLFNGRPRPLIGPINQFETTGESSYDSAQFELRGRLMDRKMQYQVNYVYGKATDNVSDVFDLAGASALPQNSAFQSGEFGLANYDVRHRVTYSFFYDLPSLKNYNSVARALFGGWQMSSQGKIRGGQPFTVNSVFDVNLDGNLTDRLNNTQLIRVNNGNPRQPISLTCSPCSQTQLQSMLAPFGQDGAVQRNTFRAGRVIELDASFSKRFGLGEDRSLQFRMDVFNFINRANFGVPVRILESPSFGQATDTITPARRFQFGLKFSF